MLNRDGEVTHLQLRSGHPLLAPAAAEAVKQWRYEPTRLAGELVEVLITLTIHFELNP